MGGEAESLYSFAEKKPLIIKFPISRIRNKSPVSMEEEVFPDFDYFPFFRAADLKEYVQYDAK